jgi:UV DNA damage endonuclease
VLDYLAREDIGMYRMASSLAPYGMDRFLGGFERLSERARERLVIANDDRTYSLSHVLALHEHTGLRVVWDILHHH